MFINHLTRELNVRIVYCGPTGSGAAANLRTIHGRLDPAARGGLVTAEAGARRTVFFDFLPEGLGQVRGYTIRLHLYALDSNDERIDDCDLGRFQDVDGVVFVADPRPERVEANIAALERVGLSLARSGYAWETIPAAIQILNQAPASALDRAELRAALAPGSRPWNEASAIDGSGMFDTLKAVTRATLVAMAQGRLKEWKDAAER